MRLITTNDPTANLSLRDAVFKGLADDGGLYLPNEIQQLSSSFYDNLRSLSFPEIAFQVAQHLLQGEISEKDLRQIVEKSMNFPVPLVEVEKGISSLELFHGPTLSFKDFGGRFMAQLFHYFLKGNKDELNILVATSGDTGSAVANGFLGVPGMRVWVLYPKGKVSRVQEQQIATLGQNVTALEVEGNFDDCQKMVKEAFRDQELRNKMKMTSANSINIARLIPQSFYYFYAFGQWGKESVVFSVPCGNFGNLTGGLLAKRMGLPVEKFVVATNVNDVVPVYLKTGEFHPGPSKETLSNAMDVGDPSNFARLQTLYHQSLEEMREELWGASFSDEETVAVIEEVYERTGYIMDPHGAVAYLGLKKYGKPGIFLETAHPAKFETPIKAEIPERLQDCLSKEKQSIVIASEYDALRSALLKG